MTEEYLIALKAGKTECRARLANGEYPYLTALDDIVPASDLLSHKSMGLMEIPVDLIAGTKTRARQNSFAHNFMPLLEPDSELAMKWDNLYKVQISEGFSDPIKVYEYLHRFYVLEGNKRVSVSRYMEMPAIMADVTRLIPSEDVIAENPVYSEFMRFYDVSQIYDIDCSHSGAYEEIAELLGQNLDEKWPEAVRTSLKSAFWRFSVVYKELSSKMPEISAGDAFVIYLRIYIRDAFNNKPKNVVARRVLSIRNELMIENSTDKVKLIESSDEVLNTGSILTKTGNAVSKVIPALSFSTKRPFRAAFLYPERITDSTRTADHERGFQSLEDASLEADPSTFI